MATPSARSWLRRTPGARRTDIARPVLLCVGVALSCSQAAPRGAPDEPVPAPAPARVPLTVGDIVGHWKWSLVSEEDGVRRVEVETWRFQVAEAADGAASGAAAGPHLVGSCERAVTFMSLDGMPFSCNQELSYRLQATYQIDGHIVGGDHALLAERDYQVTPSPCERGERRLATYQARLLPGGQLRMHWADGRQTLARIQASEANPPAASGSAGDTLTGHWRWQSRNQEGDEVRVESEAWELHEAVSTGKLEGTVERMVTVFARHGTRYACSDDTFYRYRDRYTVRGSRQGADLTVSEVAVEPEKHPCLDYHERHLDAALGSVIGEYVVLTWRGGKRQVLHRQQ